MESIIQNPLLGALAGVCLACLGCGSGVFRVAPVEDRGLRLSGCRFRGSFGATPIEDRGFRLPGCLPRVASEAHFE